jgi:hypothetical protein
VTEKEEGDNMNFWKVVLGFSHATGALSILGAFFFFTGSSIEASRLVTLMTLSIVAQSLFTVRHHVSVRPEVWDFHRDMTYEFPLYHDLFGRIGPDKHLTRGEEEVKA